MSTVLLVDDHPIVVAACRWLLERSGITAVFDASDAATGYQAFLEHEPDVVVVDLRLQQQDLGGLALIERIRSYAPSAAILVFSMHFDPHIVNAAITAGATGYLNKDAPPHELVNAVAHVRSGERYMDQQLAVRVALHRTEAEIAALTRRERQVLDLFAEGKTYPVVADELGISYKTVTNITYNLRRKLNARGLPDLIRKAIELAFVEYDWDRAFVVTNLVVKPVADLLMIEQLSRQATAVGAQLDALVLENLWRDSLRSQRWTSALVTFLSAADGGNRVVLQGYLDEFAPLGAAMISSGASLLTVAGGRTAGEIASQVRSGWSALLEPVALQATR